jgi:hypothetical protein
MHRYMLVTAEDRLQERNGREGVFCPTRLLDRIISCSLDDRETECTRYMPALNI